jgi:hypothetical protein
LEGWRQLSLLEAVPAQAAFDAAVATHPDDRMARLGEALALLQARSRSTAKVDQASQILDDLRRESPDDDPGIAAAYYLARIEQVHRLVPNRAAAMARYRALLTEHPGHFYAQLAVAKLAILLLYDDVAPDEWNRRTVEIEALLPQLSNPEALRDTRLALATAFIRLRRDHAHAYPLIAACLEDGSVTRMPHLNALLLQAAESAHQLGRAREEISWYNRFLAEFPQDLRADEIRRRLHALTPQPKAAS